MSPGLTVPVGVAAALATQLSGVLSVTALVWPVVTAVLAVIVLVAVFVIWRKWRTFRSRFQARSGSRKAGFIG